MPRRKTQSSALTPRREGVSPGSTRGEGRTKEYLGGDHADCCGVEATRSQVEREQQWYFAAAGDPDGADTQY